jgi:predicted neuraminidase
MFEQIDLFEPERYFNECHAAYICEMPNRSLIVSFFGGTREKAADVGSWIVKKKIDADTWSEPALFHKVPGKSTGTTHFFVPPERSEIWAFYNLMQGKGRFAGWSTCNTIRHIYRKNFGWSTDHIRYMIGWNTRGKVLVLDNGDYLFPMHDELFYAYRATFLISHDRGKSWRKGGWIKTPKGCLEPSVIQLRDGRLLCFLRCKEREIYQAWSADRGHHWTAPAATGIPNPDSMVELLLLPDDTIVLAYNHSTKGRCPLNLRYSKDHARTWSEPVTIADNGSEFSYPCMIYGSDRNIHLVYTNNRKTIRYTKFSPDWLIHPR